MPVLNRPVDRRDADYVARHAALSGKIAEVAEQHAITLSAGGEKAVARHRTRGRMLARERIELLIDVDAAFVELSPLAAYGTRFHVGASVVTGFGVVEGVEVAIIAPEPTVRGGTSNPYTLRKMLRLQEVAAANRLPIIYLVESGGADLPTQSEVHAPGGELFRLMSRSSSAGCPVITVVFGNATAGGAYFPGMSDHVVMIKEQSQVFLGGPPLVKMATGEDADEESLGGGEMHARTSGLADHLAEDEVDAIRITRQIVSRLNWRKLGPGPSQPADEPLYDAEELLGIVPTDLKQPFDPRDVIARLVDGSRFDEFKPLYGTSLVTGWASLHGYPVGILANARGVLLNEDSQKAAQFIQLANQVDTPLLFLQNTTGYMVGTEYEQRGMIKHGAAMVNAVSTSTVPHLTVTMAASYGAGTYGMCGRAFHPRFLFTWPNSRTAVMGGAQLAGVLSIVARQAAQATGRAFDEEADERMRTEIEEQIDRESLAPFLSGKVFDDGIVDPRDTRDLLGACLSVVHNAPVEGVHGGFGVFRF